jgi:hypothetical protein
VELPARAEPSDAVLEDEEEQACYDDEPEDAVPLNTRPPIVIKHGVVTTAAPRVDAAGAAGTRRVVRVDVGASAGVGGDGR